MNDVNNDKTSSRLSLLKGILPIDHAAALRDVLAGVLASMDTRKCSAMRALPACQR